ncbi:hypothetical protein RvY_10958 [Ramazzottius varieornatus]|uniref:Uncharacterized protein n=1 Tax=Ramazzottius varieornatus TaxID=947166 RepID=A0A1D1VEH9_RAMVA|nr:hypothetical protein RvY_10958 [Ramazzottius varieornatus]
MYTSSFIRVCRRFSIRQRVSDEDGSDLGTTLESDFSDVEVEMGTELDRSSNEGGGAVHAPFQESASLLIIL